MVDLLIVSTAIYLLTVQVGGFVWATFTSHKYGLKRVREVQESDIYRFLGLFNTFVLLILCCLLISTF